MVLAESIVAAGKLDYIQGRRPAVPCILCAIVGRDRRVRRLLVHEGSAFLVCLNLYPYNPGHLMAFPRRHLEDLRELRAGEVLALDRTVRLCLDVLDRVYRPAGYNIGWNLGRPAGASIAHMHQHVIPRYDHELGVMDLIGGKRVIVEDPGRSQRRIARAFRALAGQVPRAAARTRRAT
ncbi:MAG: HIT domain-containing protein [Planctomycetes bacterium]|nr:HIT domain-containing protein [Planctomycetota bacterium]